MSAWDGINRRKFPRVHYPCLVVIKNSEGETEAILAHTENIGTGGICVIIKKGFKMFAPVEIELDLMDMGSHIKCAGKVVWSIRRKMEEPQKPLYYDIGIEFCGLGEREQKRVEEVVTRLAKEGREVPES